MLDVIDNLVHDFFTKEAGHYVCKLICFQKKARLLRNQQTLMSRNAWAEFDVLLSVEKKCDLVRTRQWCTFPID